DVRRDLEEPVIALEDEPPGHDPVLRQVAERPRQELGDAAPLRGGVDVPHGGAGERAATALEGRLVPAADAVSRDRAEPACGARRNRDLEHRRRRAGRRLRIRAGSASGAQDTLRPSAAVAIARSLPRRTSIPSVHASISAQSRKSPTGAFTALTIIRSPNDS